MAGCCKSDSEPSGFVECKEFIINLRGAAGFSRRALLYELVG